MEKQNNRRAGYYTCKRLRMLEYLKRKGFEPYLTLPDVTNPHYNVWRFKNTPELEKAIEEYFANKE